MSGLILGLMGCGPEPAELEVDRLEEDRAVVVERPSGLAITVPTTSLPPGVREGDVVVDGRVDPALRAEALARLQSTRARLTRSALRSGDSLGSPAPAERGNTH